MKHPHLNSALMTISLISLCLLACGPKQSTDQQKVASLPDLPQADVDKLKPVPNTHLLATSQVNRPSAPPPATTPPPPCPADQTENDYTVQVSYPITVCEFGASVDASGTFYIERLGPTSKVESSRLSSEVSIGTGVTNPGPFVCRTDNGPWQGYLTESHLCIGTCSTVYSLELTNAPNPVVFWWDQRLDNHHQYVPDFQLVGSPQLVSTFDYGSCHQPPPPPPSH